MKKLLTPNAELAIRESGDPKSDVCIIFVTGFMGCAVYQDIQSHIEHFGEKGYHTITFDAPGIWNSTGTYMPYNCIQALDDIIENVCRPEQSIYIIGHSMGGLFAMYYALQHDRICGFGAMMSKIYKQETLKWKKDTMRTGTREIPGKPGTYINYSIPYTFYEQMIEISKVIQEGLPHYKKPTFFLSGSQDAIVAPEEVQHLYDISTDPKQIYTLGCEHDYRDSKKYIQEVTVCIERFLKTYI